MKKYKLIILGSLFSLTACAGFLGSKTIEDGTNSPSKDFDTVNGSIKVGSSANVGDLSTVNGSIKVSSSSSIGEASTVNGSITFAENVKAESAETVNGSIKLGNSCDIEENVETVNGSITTNSDCVIHENIETVNGSIKLHNSEIQGDIETVNGNIYLLQGSSVDDIIIHKPNKGWFNNSKNKAPKVILGKNAEINGGLEFNRKVKLYIHDSVGIDSDIENAEIINYSGDEKPYQ